MKQEQNGGWLPRGVSVWRERMGHGEEEVSLLVFLVVASILKAIAGGTFRLLPHGCAGGNKRTGGGR